MQLSNHIIYFFICISFTHKHSFVKFMHLYFVFFLFKRNQYLDCLLKKIGRQMDAEGKDDIDKNMLNISKSSAGERCG